MRAVIDVWIVRIHSKGETLIQRTDTKGIECTSHLIPFYISL